MDLHPLAVRALAGQVAGAQGLAVGHPQQEALTQVEVRGAHLQRLLLVLAGPVSSL